MHALYKSLFTLLSSRYCLPRNCLLNLPFLRCTQAYFASLVPILYQHCLTAHLWSTSLAPVHSKEMFLRPSLAGQSQLIKRLNTICTSKPTYLYLSDFISLTLLLPFIVMQGRVLVQVSLNGRIFANSSLAFEYTTDDVILSRWDILIIVGGACVLVVIPLVGIAVWYDFSQQNGMQSWQANTIILSLISGKRDRIYRDRVRRRSILPFTKIDIKERGVKEPIIDYSELHMIGPPIGKVK